MTMSSQDGKDPEKTTEGDDLLYGGTVKTEPAAGRTKNSGCCSCTRKKLMILAIILVMLLLYGIGLGIGLAVGLSKNQDDSKTGDRMTPATPETIKQKRLGAVVSDHEACSQIGRDMLMRHGSAVDAAIATLICNGVRTPHSMGIGGGSFMVVYDRASGKTSYIDGREMAPLAMTDAKFLALKANNGCFMVIFDKGQGRASVVDGRSTAPGRMTHETYSHMTNKHINSRRIGIPGELLAYKTAHAKFGRLPWGDLFQPTIKMIRDGFPMSEASAKAMALYGTRIDYTKFPILCSVFCSDPTTGTSKKAGDIVHWPKMADTLESVAEMGPDHFYNSSLTQSFVKELEDLGSVIGVNDFANYKVRTGDAYSVDLGDDLVMHTMPGATGGPVVALLSNIIQGFNFSTSNMASVKSQAETYHKIIEAMKFTYADRERLGDPDFEDISKIVAKMKSEDYAAQIRNKILAEGQGKELSYYSDFAQTFESNMGTSHVNVLSPYGDAVSVTSSINWYFGSCQMSNVTGIIWNNEMDDFTTKEGVTVNRVEPQKRPRSSMAPVIVMNKRTGEVKLVIGAAGGAKIANSIAQVLVKLLYLGVPLAEAVEDKRFQQTLSPKVVLEKGFPQDLMAELQKKHNVETDKYPYMAVVETILVDDEGVMHGYADGRKRPGQASYMYEYQTS